VSASPFANTRNSNDCGNSYLVTEGIAHEVLNRYRRDDRKKSLEVIAVTFNMRNHGDREVCYKVLQLFRFCQSLDWGF